MEDTSPEEILRIREPISQQLEMTSTIFELDHLNKSPGRDFRERHAASTCPWSRMSPATASCSRMCLRSDVANLATAFRERVQTYIPPEIVAKGAWDDIVLEGDDVDLDAACRFPINSPSTPRPISPRDKSPRAIRKPASTRPAFTG